MKLSVVERVVSAKTFLCLIFIFPISSSAEILKSFSPIKQTPTTLSVDVRQSIELLQGNRIAEAIELLQRAVKKNGEDAEAWQYLGVALSRQGKNDDARRAFEQVVRLRPESAAPHNGLASGFLQSGKLKEAEKAAQQALKLNPQSDEARYFLAAVRLKEGNIFDAVEEAEKAIEANPSFAAASALKNQAIIEIFSRVIDPKLQPNPAFERDQALIWTGILEMAPPESAVKREARIDQGKGFDRAVEVLERSFQRTPQAKEAVQWKEMAESLRFWKPWIIDLEKKPLTSVIVPLEKVTSGPRIIQMPEIRNLPAGPDTTAILLIVLSEQGKILHKLVMRRPGQGLAPLVLSLTEKIVFAPANRNGQNVTTITTLKYKISGGRIEVSTPDKKN